MEDNKVLGLRDRIRRNKKEHKMLSAALLRAYDLMLFMPTIYSGGCEKVSVGIDFSVDGKKFRRNSVTSYDKVNSKRQLLSASIAVISRMGKEGKLIEEIRVPVSELPDALRPEFLQTKETKQ